MQQSMAALSIFENRIMGVMADAWGNINMGRLQNSAQYVIFRENDLKRKPAFECGVSDEDLPDIAGQAAQFAAANCIKVTKIYVESTFQTYVENGGSSVNTADFVTGLFNIVAAFYAQEQVTIQLSELFIWNTPDNYPTAATLAHGAFAAARPNYNGNFAHLIDIRNPSSGGWANVTTSITCNNSHAFSSIYNTYAYLPVYSWSVTVMAHETGHNFGSRHTHWCGWPGGAIDNCYPVEGNCAPGPAPQGGGTVMSYCYLQAGGVNLSKGLGEHPGNLIRQRVYEATCIFADPAVPSANFTWVRNGDSFKFFVPEAQGVQYEWDFGDGSGSAMANPEHTFQGAGLYPVCLKVSNECGAQIFCENIAIDYCWQWRNPLPQGATMNDVYALDSLNVWRVGNGGVLLHTEDGGLSWQSVATYSTDTLFQIQFVDAQVGFIIGSAPYMLKTIDGGKHWEKYPYGTPFIAQAICFLTPQLGWIGGYGGLVLKTQDGGKTWKRLNALDIQKITEIHFVNPQRGWVIREFSPPSYTNDGGETWGPANIPAGARGIHFWTGQSGYLRSGGMIYETTDAGQTWHVKSVLNKASYAFFLNPDLGWALVDSSGTKLYKTINGGLTWTLLIANYSNYTLRLKPIFVNANDGFTTGSRSSDGGATWNQDMKKPLGDVPFYGIFFRDSQNGYISAQGRLLTTKNGGRTWNAIFSNQGLGGLDVFFADEKHGWLLGSNSIIYTNDGANSWKMKQVDNFYYGASAFCFVDTLHGWMTTGGAKIFKTSDGGNNWQTQILPWNGIHLRGVHFFNPQIGIAYSKEGHILRSVDGGISFNQVYYEANTSLLHHAFADTLYGWVVGHNGLVMHTQDGGKNWMRWSQVETDSALIKVFFLDRKYGWATNGMNLFYTTDGGKKWSIDFTGFGPGITDFHFLSPSSGFMVGGFGNLLKLGKVEYPNLDSIIVACIGQTAPSLVPQGDYNVRWYNSATSPDYTTTTPVISNNQYSTKKYYVSHYPVGLGDCGESERLEVTVKVRGGFKTLPDIIVCHPDTPYTLSWGQSVHTLGPHYKTILIDGCDSVLRQSVRIIQPKQTNLGKINRCTGDTLFVCGAPYTQSGTYSKLCTAYQGCDSTVTFELLVQTPPATQLNTLYRCAGSPLVIGADTLTASGPFSITLSAHNGCDSVVSGNLILLQPVAKIDGPAKICPDDTLTLFSALSPPGTQRTWRDAAGNMLGHADSLRVVQPGVYYLEAKMEADSFFCSVFDTISLLPAPPVSSLSLNAGPLTCAADGFVIAASPDPGLSFRWSGPYGWQSDKAFNFIGAAGDYRVTATNAQGCTATGSIDVPGDNIVSTFSLSENPAETGLQAPAVTAAVLTTNVQNQYPTTVDIYWERTFLDLSPGCELRIEADTNYYPVQVKSGVFSVAAGSTAPMRAHLLDDAEQTCCGIVRLLLRNTCTQKDTLTMTYLAHCSSAAQDAGAAGVTLRIVPNPATEWFELQGNLPSGAQKIKIFAVNGRLILSEPIAQDRRFTLANTPAGTYFIILENHMQQALWVGEVLKL